LKRLVWALPFFFILSACSALAELQQPSKLESLTAPAAAGVSSASQRKLVTVLLSDTNSNQLGSGVLVGSASGGHWVVTNRHVVQDQTSVCVLTSDHHVIPALVLSPSKEDLLKKLDLAFLWLPNSAKDQLTVAAIALKPVDAGKLPLVIATGFPIPLQLRRHGPLYTERPGLLVPLLMKPLQGGFDLAYTAALEKGMSGGGLFLGSTLIGINGAHAYPLWPGQWQDQSGKAVKSALNDKLELVSLGLSTPTIQEALKLVSVPSAEQIKNLVGLKCRGMKMPAATITTGTTHW